MNVNNDKFRELMRDLNELSVYLHGRGDKTQALATKFAENAKKNPGNSEFDLNQSRMLDYQHHLWHEIGNLVDKLIKKHEQS